MGHPDDASPERAAAAIKEAVGTGASVGVKRGVITRFDLSHTRWDTARRQLSDPCRTENDPNPPPPPPSAKEAAKRIADAKGECESFTRAADTARGELGAIDAGTCTATASWPDSYPNPHPERAPTTGEVRIDVFRGSDDLVHALHRLKKEHPGRAVVACHWWLLRTDQQEISSSLSERLGCPLMNLE